MPLTYRFKKGDCPSFGGASLSQPREDYILEILDYVNSQGSNMITSKDIQRHLSTHDPGDVRSVITILKKFNLSNIDDSYPISANVFFTDDGKAFANSLAATRTDNPTVARYARLAYQSILKNSIAVFARSGEPTALSLSLILNIIGWTDTLTFDEYCFALSEKIINPDFDFTDVANDIIENRRNHVSYSFQKEREKRDHTIEIVTDFSSILQNAREILQQAGILISGQTTLEIFDRSFLTNNHFV